MCDWEKNYSKICKEIEVKTIVTDSTAKDIINEINSFGFASEPYGVMFVKEVSNAYELGTKNTGDNVLLSE
ncbi:MAG TPA: hypothetical protein VFV86_03245 [Nitrososphaeraceae archaeon]|nr:hypothetical protein [Nitrososphaeraceae archaeon]